MKLDIGEADAKPKRSGANSSEHPTQLILATASQPILFTCRKMVLNYTTSEILSNSIYLGPAIFRASLKTLDLHFLI